MQYAASVCLFNIILPGKWAADHLLFLIAFFIHTLRLPYWHTLLLCVVYCIMCPFTVLCVVEGAPCRWGSHGGD
jgi:hypothetical protein